MTDESGGMLFTPAVDPNTYTVLDLNYGCAVGVIKLVEGPGWIIELVVNFLDAMQLHHIKKFMDGLMDEQIKTSLEGISNDN